MLSPPPCFGVPLSYVLITTPFPACPVRAANRTAEFASTGDWPEDEGGPLLSPEGHVLHPAPASPHAMSVRRHPALFPCAENAS